MGKYFFLVEEIKTYYFPRITFQPVFPFFLKQRRTDNNIVWNKTIPEYLPNAYAVPPPITPPSMIWMISIAKKAYTPYFFLFTTKMMAIAINTLNTPFKTSNAPVDASKPIVIQPVAIPITERII